MADALTKAPTKKEVKIIKVDLGNTTEEVVVDSNEHLALSQQFDLGKKYMFELATKNPQRELPVVETQGQKSRIAPHKEFPPYRNLILTSQIVWKGQRRMIRYYDGCDTIFTDKQPKEKEMIDQLISQSKRRQFLDGKFGCYGEDRMLLLYLSICSWNAESLFRTRTADTVFIPSNPDKRATEESLRIDEQEEALGLAKNATLTKMLIHANYLGIPTVDWDSGNELTEKEIRTEYRKEALRNSKNFIETYGNKVIEIKYYIEDSLRKGTINNKANVNKACWKSGTVICDISGLKSQEAIAERLLEFSQSEEGAEFVVQLKALYD